MGVNKGAKILALYGELGSGKTTFVQGLAKGLSLPHRIHSPTFIIVRDYPLYLKNYKRFYHVDLYRMATQADLEGLGFSEIFQNLQNIVAIEWAERLQESLPNERIDITFIPKSSEGRLITVNFKTTI